MSDPRLKLLNINEQGPGKCWCPICQRGHRERAAMGVWALRNNMVVCAYGVCASCCKNPPETPEGIEKALVIKYPELEQYLPKDYFSESSN